MSNTAGTLYSSKTQEVLDYIQEVKKEDPYSTVEQIIDMHVNSGTSFTIPLTSQIQIGEDNEYEEKEDVAPPSTPDLEFQEVEDGQGLQSLGGQFSTYVQTTKAPRICADYLSKILSPQVVYSIAQLDNAQLVALKYFIDYVKDTGDEFRTTVNKESLNKTYVPAATNTQFSDFIDRLKFEESSIEYPLVVAKPDPSALINGGISNIMIDSKNPMYPKSYVHETNGKKSEYSSEQVAEYIVALFHLYTPGKTDLNKDGRFSLLSAIRNALLATCPVTGVLHQTYVTEVQQLVTKYSKEYDPKFDVALVLPLKAESRLIASVVKGNLASRVQKFSTWYDTLYKGDIATGEPIRGAWVEDLYQDTQRIFSKSSKLRLLSKSLIDDRYVNRKGNTHFVRWSRVGEITHYYTLSKHAFFDDHLEKKAFNGTWTKFVKACEEQKGGLNICIDSLYQLDVDQNVVIARGERASASGFENTEEAGWKCANFCNEMIAKQPKATINVLMKVADGKSPFTRFLSSFLNKKVKLVCQITPRIFFGEVVITVAASPSPQSQESITATLNKIRMATFTLSLLKCWMWANGIYSIHKTSDPIPENKGKRFHILVEEKEIDLEERQAQYELSQELKKERQQLKAQQQITQGTSSTDALSTTHIAYRSRMRKGQAVFKAKQV